MGDSDVSPRKRSTRHSNRTQKSPLKETSLRDNKLAKSGKSRQLSGSSSNKQQSKKESDDRKSTGGLINTDDFPPLPPSSTNNQNENVGIIVDARKPSPKKSPQKTKKRGKLEPVLDFEKSYHELKSSFSNEDGNISWSEMMNQQDQVRKSPRKSPGKKAGNSQSFSKRILDCIDGDEGDADGNRFNKMESSSPSSSNKPRTRSRYVKSVELTESLTRNALRNSHHQRRLQTDDRKNVAEERIEAAHRDETSPKAARHSYRNPRRPEEEISQDASRPPLMPLRTSPRKRAAPTTFEQVDLDSPKHRSSPRQTASSHASSRTGFGGNSNLNRSSAEGSSSSSAVNSPTSARHSPRKYARRDSYNPYAEGGEPVRSPYLPGGTSETPPPKGWCTDEAILGRRQKDLDKAKDSAVYRRYIGEVPVKSMILDSSMSSISSSSRAVSEAGDDEDVQDIPPADVGATTDPQNNPDDECTSQEISSILDQFGVDSRHHVPQSFNNTKQPSTDDDPSTLQAPRDENGMEDGGPVDFACLMEK